MGRLARAVILTVVIAVALLGWLGLSHATPDGQPPLVDVTADVMASLKADFNRGASGTRIIVLLSPTCSICVRGASALQTVLARNPKTDTRVFIVWEPILATDFGRPVSWVLGRTPDLRVQQYWDPNHLVAKQMAADARPPQAQPDCCDQSGILWDIAAVYPKGAIWDDRLPVATVFNGTVLDIPDAIERAMTAVETSRPDGLRP